ncbi:hypothetical protein ES703_108331 [subsurface metagenome]
MTVYINGVAVGVGGYTEGARVYHSAHQEISSGGTIFLAFDSERWDTDNIHSTTVNPGRLTARTAGKYLVVGGLHWETKVGAALGDYYNIAGLYKDGQYRARTHKPAGDGFHTDVTIAMIEDFEVDEYVEMTAFQNSGDPLDAEKYGECSVEFMMQRIGD